MIYLQNKVTGEIAEVEPNSQEYRDKISEKTPENKPVWEVQSDAAVSARIQRAEAGELRETDLPKSAPVVPERNRVEQFGAERAPWKNLTAAEEELGLTSESKCNQALTDQAAVNANAQTRADAAETIAGSDTDRRSDAPVAPHVPTSADSSKEGDGNGDNGEGGSGADGDDDSSKEGV